MTMVNVPIFWFVAAFFALNVAVLVVLVKILNVLRGPKQQSEKQKEKKKIDNVSFRDLR